MREMCVAVILPAAALIDRIQEGEKFGWNIYFVGRHAAQMRFNFIEGGQSTLFDLQFGQLLDAPFFRHSRLWQATEADERKTRFFLKCSCVFLRLAPIVFVFPLQI